jgi:tmRNA-binding protein
MPDSKNKSPTLLIKNAFVAAFPACTLVYQNPINKYEHSPTPSHPRNRTRKLLDATSSNIKNVNKER